MRKLTFFSVKRRLDSQSSDPLCGDATFVGPIVGNLAGRWSKDVSFDYLSGRYAAMRGQRAARFSFAGRHPNGDTLAPFAPARGRLLCFRLETPACVRVLHH